MLDIKNQAQQQDHNHEEALNKAMNLVGQNLYDALRQTLQQLPSDMRKREIILQGIAGFLSNIICQQAPKEAVIREEMLAEVNKLVNAHLHELTPVS